MTKLSSQKKTPGMAAFLLGALLVAWMSPAAVAQLKVSAPNDPANGAGVVVAGEFWDSYLPPSSRYYQEAASPILRTLRVGNFDRAWTTPTHMWPGGWQYGAFWNKAMEITVWDPDPNFNPAQIGGATNPSHYSGEPNYAYAGVGNPAQNLNVPGTNDPNRNYLRETKWVDPTKRHQVLYEAGWPTTVGVDVGLKIHQYTLNWNNFNDFMIVELTFTNTGVVDMNADGTPEMTNHVIEAIATNMHGEYMSSYVLSITGGRGNRFFATRAIGWVGDNDPSGAPWNIHVAFPGESGTATADMGIFAGAERYMADVWSAWSFLGAKDATGTDFPTRFGTHAVGVGAERGWYTTAGVGKGFSLGRNNPKDTFIGSIGTYYVDGGKSLDGSKFNLAANPNLFDPGSTAGDLRTFVLKAAGRTAPDGDLKRTNTFGVNPYESGWTTGYTAANNFDGDGFMGIGPFRLAVGQSVTVAMAVAGGYRWQGVANAISTARWVYANKTNAAYALPFDYPAVPEMRVDNTLNQSIRVRWDNRANTGPGFAGYKIYKTSLSKQVDFLQTGMRVLDNYWRNMTPGPTPDALKVPVNPGFTAQAYVAGRTGVPDTWGPYELVAVIPAANLANFADNSLAGYNYSWEDRVVDIGFKYWYYVSAYTNQSLTLNNYVSLNNPATTDFVETSNVNRNGASGLWQNTYPWTERNSFFPKTAQGLKDVGTGFIVKSALANPADLVSGRAKVKVKPNPYKQKALFDDATQSFDHKITFINLPSGGAKITILDVSGQIIDEIDFQSSDPNNGSTFWDMFSKDGNEVASGLYIYVVEYTGGKQVGYFSILR